ncbi:MAG: hypothetical protein F6K31_23825, partial [Symploca sp. SIO2G7]|nr:hypothetical protein [Symploca sp. SIO2G7]
LIRPIRTINSNTETVKSYHCCLLPVACCLLHKYVFNLVQDLSVTDLCDQPC